VSSTRGGGETREGCPWENRGRHGTFAALGETLQKSLFRPTEFFRQMRTSGGTGSSLVYAVIVGTLTAAVAMMWQRALGSSAPWVGQEWEVPPVVGYFWYAGLAAMPLIIVAAVAFRSFLLHVSLLILGGAKESFEATLKVVAYATSASAFNVFPLVGSPIAFVWRVVLLVTGLRETHRISTARAFAAWLLPFLVIAFVSIAALIGLVLGLMKLWPNLGEYIEV